MGTGHPLSGRPTPNRPTFRSSRRSAVVPPRGGQPGDGGGPDRNLHTIVIIDVVRSARHDSQGQRRMREHLYEMVRDVVQYGGFELESLPLTDTGDGLRICIPLHRIQPTQIVDMFVLGLAARLREHRRDVTDAARIRMRIAFDLGLIEPHLLGWTGGPLIRVARLLDAESLRLALRADDRLDLAAVVSDVFYEEVVRHGYGYIGPSCFRRIRVTVKDFDAQAWQLTSGTAGMCGQCYSAAA